MNPPNPGPDREIAELRRMQQQLRLSEARFRALTELSADWFWEQDENFRFVDAGKRYPLGIPPAGHIVGIRTASCCSGTNPFAISSCADAPPTAPNTS
jgi:hypothetical protein